MTKKSMYRQQVLSEVEALPPEFLPFLLDMIRAYRARVSMQPAAAASFQRGWQEAQGGWSHPCQTSMGGDRWRMSLPSPGQ